MSANICTPSISDTSIGTSLSKQSNTPLSPEDISRFRTAWKIVAQSRLFTSRDMAAFCILTGASPDKTFTPISNVAKLANGARPFGLARKAWQDATYDFEKTEFGVTKPDIRAYPSMRAWFQAIREIPRIPNTDMLRLFSDPTAIQLKAQLGSLHITNLAIYDKLAQVGKSLFNLSN